MNSIFSTLHSAAEKSHKLHILYKVSRYIYITCLPVIMCMLLSACSKEPKTPVQLVEGTGTEGNNSIYAVVDVQDYGRMKFRLLKDQAPEAVEAFSRLAGEGYYDQKPVYMLIKDYCMISGSESDAAYSVSDDATLNSACYPLRGALCFTRSEGVGKYSCSDFTVIQTSSEFLSKLEELLEYKKVTPGEYFKQAYGNDIDEDSLSIFKKYGGAPWLYGHCIVFGQLTEGEEVLDRICSVEVYDDSQFKPMEDIIINCINIE